MRTEGQQSLSDGRNTFNVLGSGNMYTFAYTYFPDSASFLNLLLPLHCNNKKLFKMASRDKSLPSSEWRGRFYSKTDHTF